uniref:G-protein coupled receptors family 1 profile domain-containing protein n=1 Tax=Stomoxys calcitrans TaxID=35570 RepID=A0A1I8PR15_STOCA
MDVLLCTSSIMNLCLISLDRYWSITKAVDYLKSRTPARAALMIAAVWIMSALICIPPLLGWKVKMPEGPLPKCALSEDIGYVLYSALGSFYIPSCIMVFVYIRIYFAAKARARRGIKKHPRKTNNEQVTSFTTANKKGTIPMPSSSAGALQKHQQHQIATIETPPNSAGALPMQIPTVTCDLASDISTSEAAEMEPHPLMYPNAATVGGCSDMAETALSPTALETPTTNNLTSNCNDASSLRVSTITTAHGALNVPVPPSMAANNNSTTTAALNNNNNGTLPTTAAAGTTLTATTTLLNTKPTTTLSAATNELKVSPIAGRCRALSVGIDTDMVSEFDPSSSDSGVVSRCAVVKPLKFRLCQPIFGRKSNNRRQNEAKAAAAAAAAAAASAKDGGSSSTPTTATTKADIVKAELEPAIPKPQKPRDPEKEKRRIARKKEKRATLILGLIMGSFIACWLPFFFLYILMPACSTHCHIPDSAFAIAFWLGYMNSALNPAIYTIFNKDFRRAFRRILFKAAAAAAASAKDGGSSSTPTTATTKADIVKAELEPAIPKPQKPRDPEKEKRRIARKKEKRATLILGLIMGSFIACWLPFFFLYILMPACSTHCHIPDSAFAIAFWLGYMNSALNPAIYTIFNKDFRRAFRRILFK